uniref:Uncharacterized protein n=1 Tax=Aegilops tauschii subsp. strangulata TaxID=200361 RepID=A0A453T5G2_AEGTS
MGATSSSPTGCETRGVEGGFSRTYHPASLLLSQRKVNMKLQKICKVQSILNLLTHDYLWWCCSGAHHLDFRSATKDDPDWVVEQRRQEVEIIHGWIDQYNKDIAQM